jgi:small-conductance mechanosensitive channel
VRIRSECVRAVEGRFDEAGITMPFPQCGLSGDVGLAGETAPPPG